MTPDETRDRMADLERRLGAVVLGQERAVRQLIWAYVAGGHVLLEGPPGLGKTLLVQSFATLVDASFRRIQFTPDLMPADVLGTTIFRPQDGTFEFSAGPVFTEILMADEINRTPPKTQAALLEAMQEGQVTMDGKTRPLPPGFFVAATQNPLEYEGTYPLPEAQLDRFLLKVRLEYPDAEAEQAILEAHGDRLELKPAGLSGLHASLDAATRSQLRQFAASVRIDPSIRDYLIQLVHATREDARLRVGASTRGAVLWMFVAKVAAACDGRDYLRPDDLKETAHAVLRHRLTRQPETEIEGVEIETIVDSILERVKAPGLEKTESA
ncbi:MAG: MoxR family ATPase [Planctomycetota bacterium]|nr:MoxR family ATPase [Planctomycetota bacterium]